MAAKAPGVTHCYKRVCHRVKTIAETRALIGRTVVVTTSHYGSPGIDRFNRGTFTSNGERFHAGDPGRAASSDLPDGTEVVIRNPANGRVSHVRINDFGPFRGNRKLDVTRRVAADLGFTKAGVVDLEVTVIAAPREADVPYRRNRTHIKAKGALGVIEAEDMTPLIATLIAERGEPAPSPAIAIAEEPSRDPIPGITDASAVEPVTPETLSPDLPPDALIPDIQAASTPAATTFDLPADAVSDAAPDAASPVVAAVLPVHTKPPETANPSSYPAGIETTETVRTRIAGTRDDAIEPAASLQTSEAALWSLMGLLTTWLLWTAGRAKKGHPSSVAPSPHTTSSLIGSDPSNLLVDAEGAEEAAVAIVRRATAASRPARTDIGFARPLPPIDLVTISFAPRPAPHPPT